MRFTLLDMGDNPARTPTILTVWAIMDVKACLGSLDVRACPGVRDVVVRVRGCGPEGTTSTHAGTTGDVCHGTQDGQAGGLSEGGLTLALSKHPIRARIRDRVPRSRQLVHTRHRGQQSWPLLRGYRGSQGPEPHGVPGHTSGHPHSAVAVHGTWCGVRCTHGPRSGPWGVASPQHQEGVCTGRVPPASLLLLVTTACCRGSSSSLLGCRGMHPWTVERDPVRYGPQARLQGRLEAAVRRGCSSGSGTLLVVTTS